MDFGHEDENDSGELRGELGVDDLYYISPWVTWLTPKGNRQNDTVLSLIRSDKDIAIVQYASSS